MVHIWHNGADNNWSTYEMFERILNGEEYGDFCF